MTTVHIVPAAPGYCALTPCDDGFETMPIIAWRIEVWALPSDPDTHHTSTYPVGIEDIAETWPVRLPDGRIVFADLCSFEPGAEADAMEYVAQLSSPARGRPAAPGADTATPSGVATDGVSAA